MVLRTHPRPCLANKCWVGDGTMVPVEETEEDEEDESS